MQILREPDQPVTFFNIQRYLKPHYPMSEKEKKALDVTPRNEEVNTVVPDADTVEEAPKEPVNKPPPKKRVVRNPKSV